MNNLNVAQKEFLETLLAGDTEKAVSIAKQALGQGTSPTDFFSKYISPSLEEIGKMFETLEIFLPEMVTAADVVQEVNDKVIAPAVDASQNEKMKALGKVLMATVKGDLHDIGKNMVSLMLKVNGFDVIDMGTNVAPSEIVERAQVEGVNIIGLSSLLTTCLPYMKDVNDYLEEKGIRDQFHVIIGGAAITPQFAHDIGADGFGKSAAEAVALCQKLIKE